MCRVLDAIKGRAVVCPVDDPGPLAFFNIYEPGDIWLKAVGCEGCSADSQKKCCGTCPLLTELGCTYHLRPMGSNKPFNCIIQPAPDRNWSWCQQEWLCVRGSHKGKIRRIREPADVFVKIS